MDKHYKSPQTFDKKIILAEIKLYAHQFTKKEMKKLKDKFGVIFAQTDEELFVQYNFALTTLLSMAEDLEYFLFLYPRATKIVALNPTTVKQIKSALHAVEKRINKIEKMVLKKE